MDRHTAEVILESFDFAQQQWHECRAEAGMGAVSMGWSGYDGMSVYSAENPYPQEDDDVREARAYLAEFPVIHHVYPRHRSELPF